MQYNYKEIEDFPGYFAADNGRIYKSTDNAHYLELVPNVLRNHHGYLLVSLKDINGAIHKKYVHELVAKTYFEDKSLTHDVIHHNGHKRDNRPVNLSWRPKTFKRHWWRR